jgi:hypothetical protein
MDKAAFTLGMLSWKGCYLIGVYALALVGVLWRIYKGQSFSTWADYLQLISIGACALQLVSYALHSEL